MGQILRKLYIDNRYRKKPCPNRKDKVFPVDAEQARFNCSLNEWLKKLFKKSRNTVEEFAKAFNCELTIWEIREHQLHTRQQLDILYSWIDNKIQTDE